MRATKQQVIQRYRADVLPALDAIVRAAAVADRHANMTFDWPLDAVTLDLREAGDTIMVMREDIDGAAQPEVRFARLDFDPIRVARQMFDLASDRTDHIDTDHAGFYASHLEQVARARFVIIIYTHQQRMPRPDGAREYVGGTMKGVGVVVELATMAVRGAFEWFVGSSGQVRAKDGMLHHVLRDDLAKHFCAELLARISHRFPDAQMPVTLGY